MNYIVWKRGLRGPSATLDLMDPRQMPSWREIEPSVITIVPLDGVEQGMHLETLVVLHPCPEVAE